MVELTAAGAMSVVNEPVLFPDGGFPGEARNEKTAPVESGTSATAGYHDIGARRPAVVGQGRGSGSRNKVDLLNVQTQVPFRG